MSEPTDLETLAEAWGRYPAAAFMVVGEGLRHASKVLGRDAAEGPDRHLSAAELTAGVLDVAAERYGLLAVQVLKSWGLHGPSDIGAITFHLIDHGILGKQPGDRQEDFDTAEPFAPGLARRCRDQLAESLR